jgi:TetR/AcrR family transcriptional regulator, tetracycline repressor protein
VPEDAKRATRPPRRPGRPRPGESILTRRSILTAALELVDEHGIEALSMRRLATRLAVDPMSIYHHVPNKAALISGVVEIVFTQMPQAAAAGESWSGRVRDWARSYRDLAFAHPNLVLQIVTDSAAASEAAVLIGEPLYAAFDAAGLTPREVVNAAGTIVDFVNGYALALAGPTPQPPSDRDPMTDQLAALEPEQVPTMRRIHAHLDADPATPTGFDAGIDIIIRGIQATASQRPSSRMSLPAAEANN